MNDHLSSEFEPLDLFDISKLSERSRHALASDFAASNQTGRLRAMLAHIPFSKMEGGTSRLDTHLLAKTLNSAEMSWLAELAQSLANATHTCRGYISNEGRTESDCGPLAAFLTLRAIKAMQSNPQKMESANIDL